MQRNWKRHGPDVFLHSSISKVLEQMSHGSSRRSHNLARYRGHVVQQWSRPSAYQSDQRVMSLRLALIIGRFCIRIARCGPVAYDQELHESRYHFKMLFVPIRDDTDKSLAAQARQFSAQLSSRMRAWRSLRTWLFTIKRKDDIIPNHHWLPFNKPNW